VTGVTRQRIDDYASSMFRYEQLHDEWIAACTKYLRSLFGDTLRGKTVVDYAFGRGNWSLAFHAAGASRVVAVDTSSTAVARFADYCSSRNISGIEVVTGDILEEDLGTTGDLIWLYGILPVVEDQAAFLTRVKTLAASSAAQIYVYYYNAGSLREFIVETCRSALIYESEQDFRENSVLFVRPARMRARDDLTSPHVQFSTAYDARDVLRSCGIYITRQDRDFQHFLVGRTSEDFCPHQFLCSLRPEDEVEVAEPPVPYAKETGVLKAIADDVLAPCLSSSQKRKVAVGLFNTHFAFLRDGGVAQGSVIELGLFLLYTLLQRDVDVERLNPISGRYYTLFRAALAAEGQPQKLRLLSGIPGDNELADYLVRSDLRA
jgi:Methyltransferase domain